MAPATLHAFSIFNDIAFWFTVLPICVGILRFKECSYGLRSLVVLSIVSITVDSLTELFRGTVGAAYIPRVFTIAEFTLITVFFLGELTRPKIRRTIIAVNILFIGVVIVDLLLQGTMQFDDLSTGIESIVFLIYSVTVLFFIMRDMIYRNLLSTPQFWIIAGIMIYFGGNVFLFVFSNYLISISIDLFTAFWYGLHGTMMISFSTLISIGLWKARKQYQ